MTLARSRRNRRIAALAITGAALFATPACSSDDGPTTTTTSTTSAPTTTEADATTTAVPADEDRTAESASTGTRPEWAQPFETPGEKLTTLQGEGFTVDVYQVGTAKASEDGNFVDPETNEPILAEGDPVVFVNDVFTNTGETVIRLPYSLVAVGAEYADWKWMGGMDTVTDADLYAEMGVLDRPVAPGAGEAPFLWEPGTSWASGDSFAYQPGSAITFTAVLVPADEEGDQVSAERQEVEAEATIT